MPYHVRTDFKWWTKDDSQVYDTVKNVVAFLKNNDAARSEAILRHMRLYGNMDIVGFSPRDYVETVSSEKLSLNVIKAVVDTVSAKIAKNRPHPRFLTSRGNYTLKRRARLLEKFVEGQFYQAQVYREMPRAFIDCAVIGTGAVKVWRDPGSTRIQVERVFPGELFVDPAEALYGKPRQLFQQKYVCREVLKEMFPDKALDLDSISTTEYDEALPHDKLADQVLVTEAWHLPSGPGAEDGKHVIVTDNATLFSEGWKKEYFPFVFIRWSERLRGFWGAGLAEELTGIQVEINRLLRKIQKAFHLLAVPRVFVDAGSRVNKAFINNQIGAIIPYVGRQPIVYTPQTVHPELFAHLERLYQRAFEIAGVNQMSATGSVPRGIDAASGRALLVHNDIETERFALVGRQWEEAHMDLARMMVELGKEISEEFPNYSVVAEHDRNTVEEVRWADVDLPRDAYVLKVYPQSVLPSLPSGKIKMIEQLIGLGAVPREEVPHLLDFPDLDSYLSLDRAMSEYIERVVERILDEGEYEAPEPFIDLQLALKKVQAAYATAVNDGVPEDRLRLLRRFMKDVNRLIKQVQAETQNLEAPPAAAAPPAFPGTGQPLTAAVPTT